LAAGEMDCTSLSTSSSSPAGVVTVSTHEPPYLSFSWKQERNRMDGHVRIISDHWLLLSENLIEWCYLFRASNALQATICDDSNPVAQDISLFHRVR
jgi:hypothetical protein